MGILHGSRAFIGPLHANLSLTNRCNISCIHCYFYSKYLDKPNMFVVRRARLMGSSIPDDEYLRRLQRCDVDSTQILKLIDRLIRTGTRRFSFTGGGEPFLHKNALDFMERAKHYGSICMVSTNGTLLNHETIDKLIRIKFNDLRITTMAGTRKMYIRTHTGITNRTFDDLRDNLLYLAERKASFGTKYPEVTLICIVIAQNYRGIFDFAKFANLVKANRVIYYPVDDLEDPNLAKLVPTEKQALSVRKQLKEIKKYLDLKRIDNNISNFLIVFRKRLDTRALYSIIPCYIGWLAVRIDADGLVYPCCRCYEPLGNIFEKDFYEIWNGNTYRIFRREAITITKRGLPVNGCSCYSCPIYTVNLRVYRALHPVKGRSARFTRI